MVKFFRRVVLWLFVLVVVLFFARNWLARHIVQTAVKQVTGLPLQVASVHVDLMRSQLDVRGIRLQNPPDFPETRFVDMPRLSVNYSLPSLLTGRKHVRKIHIEIDQLVLVKNQRGESNVQKLRGVRSGEATSQASYRLDELRVRIGKVIIKDYSRARPTERTIVLNLDRTYRNITEQTSITRLVLVTMLGPVPLPEFGISTAHLLRGLESVTDAAGKTVSFATETFEQAGRSVVDTLKKLAPGN
ncbi:MAG: AsmA family protein [Verrucomicrobiae bacterium]|nr:AsmA family protein [Verrucomicrobiae bacterium]